MSNSIDDIDKLSILNYKCRKEKDDYIVLFQGINQYFVINEVAKDIIHYMSLSTKLEGFSTYMSSLYGELDSDSTNEIASFIDNLKEMKVIS